MKTLCPSIYSFITTVHSIPVLTHDEERHLARRYRDHNDLDAAKQLVLAHLKVVVKIARSYKNYGLIEADLIQEGNVGLMKAVKNFDPEHGVRLMTYASRWIRAEITEYVVRNWRIVKLGTTKDKRKLFFNLRKLRSSIELLKKEEVKEMAQNLSVAEKEVREAEQYMLGRGADHSFDPYPGAADAEVGSFHSSFFEDNRYDPATLVAEEEENKVGKELLRAALAQLDERSRAIIAARYITDKKTNLSELAKQYGVSAERVRQIEKVALAKLRELV